MKTDQNRGGCVFNHSLIRLSQGFLLLILLTFSSIAVSEKNNTESSSKAVSLEKTTQLDPEQKLKAEPVLGINTADVREDISSIQFLNLFRSAIPFKQTVPWGSSKGVRYDENGWPKDLKGGQAGTKFLNRLPDGTIEDGFFTVLYDGEGEIFYGNDARLVVHQPNKDIIEIKSGKDKTLNASLFIKKTKLDNYIRNIRILPEGGICKGAPHIRVKTAVDCGFVEYLSFEENHLNVWAKEQREKAQKEDDDIKEETVESKNKEQEKTQEKISKSTDEKQGVEQPEPDSSEDAEKDHKLDIKGKSEISEAIVFNPEYLNFMKDFQLIRFMNMSGMTRNPVKKWKHRNKLKKATWGGKYGSRGAPVEIMVALANQVNAHPWFSIPYKASNDYIEQFADYVNKHLDPEHEHGLKAYIEYSNEVWNPIFTHHDYAIKQGRKARLDRKKSKAGYKWYSVRSVETFKIWEKAFGGTDRLVRVMGSWVSNQIMSSTVLAYKDAYKHTDVVAIGPYVSAHPRVLRRAKTVDDVFRAMLDKRTKWGMQSTVNYIKKQAKVAKSFGVDLVAYEGGQHLVDWNTRKVEEHPNPLLYAANRDPRMGIIYDELMEEWHRADGKLFVAFSAPRIYSWYGSWGIKEHIRQSRFEAPKYDSLLRYLNTRLYPQQTATQVPDSDKLATMSGELPDIPIAYAKKPQLIWDMSHPQIIDSTLRDNSQRDFAVSWQANWDSKNLYLSFAISDDDLQKGDKISLTLDTTTATQQEQNAVEQDKIDIEVEKELMAKIKKERAARRKKYEEIAKTKKEAVLAKEKTEKEELEKKKKVKKEEDSQVAKKEDKTETQGKGSVKTEINNDKDNNKDKEEKQESESKSVEKNAENKKSESKKADNDLVSDVQKSIVKELQQALDKAAKVENVNVASNSTKDKKNEGEKDLDSKNKKTTEVEKENTDKKDSIDSQIEIHNENVQTFSFSPFDDLNDQSRTIITDSGYLMNVAIPWSEVYKNSQEEFANVGSKLGINIVVNDSDKGEKGSKELRSADTSIPLPKIVLKNTIPNDSVAE